MGFLKEFKEFAIKGNAMDLAVGVIIGAAFGKIVDSIVNDLIMPVIGIVFNADFSNLYIPLSDKITEGMTLEQAKAVGPVFAWGNFITILFNFLILAFIVFLLVRAMNKMRKKEEEAPAAPPAPTPSESLLAEIRDELKKRN
ncbi:MAG: large conductance mechanosensitive channel protein MscL [Saprospiraceae bacterium]|nr:large conductance mechanosensitive channel protein MscL [Saprospiraceae bacterium]